MTGNIKSCGCLHEETLREFATIAGKISAEKRRVSAGRKLYVAYKWEAANDGREFSLTVEDFERISQKNCYYCGSLPEPRLMQRLTPTHCNGLDRVDNKKGYTLDNVVPCCAACNRFKSSTDYDTFITRIRKIYEHLIGGNPD